ncbi:GNAT family N-acetyltransferase [Anaerofustis stercorihominis]|uniref:GNAT family N-acetyltransferase n=1 Tax=Anaerofustis stercorihominis TaxID=214853 RepID=UPI00214B5219|nr:GNAT family N-acetyltransferase [Anaerofustis stercorihominis]MCR2033559.1 GNAT family N-acetyltransferase [Anaerofustis stercorihominis]
MEIRSIKESELLSALDLVWKVFLKYEAPSYSKEGIEEFKSFLRNKEEISRLKIYGYFEDKDVIGVIAIRENHICLFFVDDKYHRKGIGRKLFNYVRCIVSEDITVNSSPYAVKVYHKLGFTDTDKEQTTNGIIYTPMIYKGI